MRRHAAVAVLLVVALLTGCTSNEEAAAAGYADILAIDGFRRVSESESRDGSSKVLRFVGPLDADVVGNLAPTSLVAIEPLSEPPGPVFEPAVWFQDLSRTDDLRCFVVVRRLKAGKSPYSTGMTQEEVRQVEEGELAFLEVTIFCGPPPPKQTTASPDDARPWGQDASGSFVA